jgi:ankyrin repeat protein
MIYCSQGDLEVVRRLLQNGAVIDKLNDSGQCCMHFAARSGNSLLVQCLLDCHVPVNRKDCNQEEPIHKAIISRDLKTVNLLIARGVQLNGLVNGRTLLMLALEMDDNLIFKALLNSGADPTIVGSHNCTVHQLAQESNNRKMLDLLEKNKHR